MVCNDPVPTRISTGDESRSVYHRRTWINRMVIAENDSFMGNLPKRGRIFLADKIRAHSIPNHDNDMAVKFWRARCEANDTRRKNEGEDQNRCAIFREHVGTHITQTRW